MNSRRDRKTDSIKTGKAKAQRMKTIQKSTEKYQMHIYLVIKTQSNAIICCQLNANCYLPPATCTWQNIYYHAQLFFNL